MDKILKLFLLVGSLFILSTKVNAEMVAGNSAQIHLLTISSSDANDINKIYRTKIVIKTVLERYNSPLINEVDNFVNTCQKYNLDCYLLPSISGLESTFGRFILPGSFNPFGWGGGYILFNDWGQGIDAVGKGLKENYINRGAVTISEIGPIYSESATWAVRVENIMNQFKQEEDKLPLFLGANKVEL